MCIQVRIHHAEGNKSPPLQDEAHQEGHVRWYSYRYLSEVNRPELSHGKENQKEEVMESIGQEYFGRHRSCSIKKVENGFSVTAVFNAKNSEGDYYGKQREFVFMTIDEVELFVRDYMTRAAAELETL